MFMKTLKDYIKLLEDDKLSPGLRAVGVTPSSLEDEEDGFVEPQGGGILPEKRTPVSISTTISSSADGMPTKSVTVTANPETTYDFGAGEENAELLRHVLKTGGVPMPDENPDIANTSGITVIVTNDSLQANSSGEGAEKLLKLLQDAGLADENGEAIVLQKKDDEHSEEVTEDAVEEVVRLAREIRK
jgi:hypothetical protein